MNVSLDARVSGYLDIKFNNLSPFGLKIRKIYRKYAKRGHIVKLEVFGGHLLSEDDHSHWVPPYWNIMKKTVSLGRTELYILLQKMAIESFWDFYKEMKSSFYQIIPTSYKSK